MEPARKEHPERRKNSGWSGSITSLTNGSGTIANSYTYDSFGNLTASSGSVTNPFQYTGRDFDSETGLSYYRARYYDPFAGRLLSEDTFRFRAGINFYAYVKNRPLNYVDPSGFNGIDWSWIWKVGNKVHDLGSKLTCIVGCYNCLSPTCDNAKGIGKAQEGGPPVYTPADEANQGSPSYTGAPIESEGVRQIQMAVASNSNCKDCVNNCLSDTLVIGMFPHQ